MGKRYLVVSTAVTDRLYPGEGASRREYLGGAGIYALSGIRLWSDDVKLVTGVGGDFERLHGDWFFENGIDRSGLLVRDAHTAVSQVRYREDGERVETPLYGPEHYKLLEASPEDVRGQLDGVDGLYVFKEADEAYWEKILAYRRELGFRLMWEINASSARPDLLPLVRKIAEGCDIFSINRTEAFHLFGTRSLETACRCFRDWTLPMVFLRTGAEGAVMMSPEGIWHIPPVKGIIVADQTGAGNSSSAAVLCGYCEGRTPYECGVMGSISAARCIEQFGPPAFSERMRREAEEALAQAAPA